MGSPAYRKRILANLAFYLCLFAAAGLVSRTSIQYPSEFDWTLDNRNTLSPASQNLLKELEGPVRIIAYASKPGELRNRIRIAIDRFRRFKEDLILSFVNPDEDPDAVRELGIRVDGEMIVHYQGRSESLRELSESAITNTLYRLSNIEQRWIVFLSGHGERSPSGPANHDLGQFGQQLQNKGFRILELKTTPGASIPDNASLLVIADPVVEPLPGESDSIVKYITHGGNLFWLRDSERIKGLDAVNDLLGIRFPPGIIVDANSRAYGINNPAFVTLSEYPPHPITENIHSISLFPKSGAIESEPSTPFHSAPVLESSAQSWSEQGPIKSHIQFNPEQGEKRGPLNLGLALTRAFETAEQRILVVGDGDFLSNTYLGNGINLDLGLNMIQWLTKTGNSLSIPIRFQPDQSLLLSPEQTAALGFFFLFVIPAMLMVSGLMINRRRKRS
ncbi:MAG: GldG family protein [Methylococcales bacterium]